MDSKLCKLTILYPSFYKILDIYIIQTEVLLVGNTDSRLEIWIAV